MQRTCPLLVLLALLLLLATHCSPSLDPPSPTSSRPGDDAAASAPLAGDDASPIADPAAQNGPLGDAGFAAGDDSADPLAPAGDASDASDDPADAAPEGACTQPLATADLAIDELMIESVAGTGDYGEWLEIANTLLCTANLRGLHGETAAGARIRSFDVSDDVWLPPGGTLVVADSEDPTLNHDLPGLVLAWAGHPGDVLRNQGGTVTLTVGETLIDTVTWPAYKLAVGVSLEYSAGCPVANRANFALWQPATTSWFPGFLGTPNAPNTDVPCP
jgi:hypothetical protein